MKERVGEDSVHGRIKHVGKSDVGERKGENEFFVRAQVQAEFDVGEGRRKGREGLRKFPDNVELRERGRKVGERLIEEAGKLKKFERGGKRVQGMIKLRKKLL